MRETVRLKRIARMRYGSSLPAEERREGSVPVFGSAGPVGRHDTANTSGPVIVVGRKGTYGKVSYSREPVFVIDTAYFIDSSCTNADLRWLKYALEAANLDQLSRDVGVPGLSREAAYAAPMPVASPEEQRQIADYLDREVARLEALSEMRSRVAQLARQRIDRAILGRVVPGSASWEPGAALSTIPFTALDPSWRPVRLRFTVEAMANGTWGNDPTGGDDDIRCVRVADFDYPRGRAESAPTVRAVSRSHRRDKALLPDDLLIEKSGGGERQPVGRVVRWTPELEEPAVCSNFIARMRPRPGFDSGYLQLLHRALYSTGITSLSIKQTTGIQNLDADHYLSRMIPIPELREQVSIREELEELVAAERRLAELSERQGELLDEHRKAIVSAAVTDTVQPSLAGTVTG